MRTTRRTLEIIKSKIRMEGVAAVADWIDSQKDKNPEYYNHIILSLLSYLKEGDRDDE